MLFFYAMNAIICIQMQCHNFMKWWNIGYFLQHRLISNNADDGKEEKLFFFLNMSHDMLVSKLECEHRTWEIAVRAKIFL